MSDEASDVSRMLRLDDECAADREPGLRTLAIRGSAWTIAGYGVQQVVRLGSNIIATRLLFPRAYGIMAIVWVFLQGLEMFSDLGLSPSIIQNRRGDEPGFLRTAWTVQVVRGFLIAGFAVVLAWPLAAFYRMPELRVLLPAAGAISIVGGLNSTLLFSLNRRLEIGRLTLIEVGSHVFGTCVMLLNAWLWPSVWALLVGGLVSANARMALSHCVIAGPRMRFHWDRQVFRDLFHFGKWIFLSTILTFILGRVDRIILGRFMLPEVLGVYSIAALIANAVAQALQALAGKVLFPVYSRLAELGRDRLRSRTLRLRLALTLLALPPLYLLILWGPAIVNFVFDERYRGAGWMLQILAAGAAFSVVNLTTSPVLLAVGDSFRHMIMLVFQSIVLLSAMSVCAVCLGTTGIILGMAIGPPLSYPFLVWCVRRYGVWLPWLDLVALGCTAAVCGVAYAV